MFPLSNFLLQGSSYQEFYSSIFLTWKDKKYIEKTGIN